MKFIKNRNCVTLCILLSFVLSSCIDKNNKHEAVVFSALGDVPYGEVRRSELIDYVKKHNAKSNSKFIIHLGDIKAGKTPCDEFLYKDVDSILKNFKTPTFIILGDNEFNDCEDPTQAMEYWNKYFLHFNENWSFKHKVSYQKERLENFSWVENKVLFIGVNLVGGTIHNKREWKQRLTHDANFIQELLTKKKHEIESTVIFAHANIVKEDGPVKYKTFIEIFLPAAKQFNKPILFLNGDGHVWVKDKPWPNYDNITRVQVDEGANATQIIVDTNLEDPFLFNRNFLKD